RPQPLALESSKRSRSAFTCRDTSPATRAPTSVCSHCSSPWPWGEQWFRSSLESSARNGLRGPEHECAETIVVWAHVSRHHYSFMIVGRTAQNEGPGEVAQSV